MGMDGKAENHFVNCGLRTMCPGPLHRIRTGKFGIMEN